MANCGQEFNPFLGPELVYFLFDVKQDAEKIKLRTPEQ